MSEFLSRRGDLLWSPSNFQLTRRAFLKATCLVTGIGSAALFGCGGPTGSGVKPISTTVYASQGLPDGVVPMGLGVNVHFNTASDTNSEIERLAELGFRFVRLDLPWNLVEQQKGHYDFSSYERLIGALAAHGIRSLCILAYNNPLYDNTPSPPSTVVGPHTDEARQAFGRFAATATAKFKGHRIVWEIWNEPDLPRFWQPKPNPDDYMALARVATSAMRQADHNATIVAPALTGLEPKYQEAWNYLERCFALGLPELVDAISVHPYRLGPPESAPSDYERLRTLIAHYVHKGKENMPIISSEWGYSMTWVSQEQQAAYFVRLFLINMLSNLPLSIWYDWRDDGPDPKQMEQNFGIVTWNGQPKMAYFAAQTLTRELAGFRLASRVPLASDADYALLFTNGAARKQVLWTTDLSHSVTLPVQGPSVKVTSMTGEKRTLPMADGKVALELTGNPQYLTVGTGVE
jgi:beta-xylosidase